ncbi:1372_t:CDS:2, partial [Racocetra fulgida]
RQEISQNNGFLFENIVKLVDSGSEELSSLEIPETSEMSSYRVNIRDLGVKMEKSDIIVKNGKRISEVLFGLDKEIQATGDELEEFRHQAKGFLFSLASEMKAITQEIEKSQWLEYVLEKQIPGFQEQLKKVITAIYSVRDSADNTHGYLIDGEREAEHFLKQYWLGNIADHVTRKRTEDELLRVRTIIKMLKEIAPNLIKFENFLKEYRRHIQDVAKEVKNSPTTAEDLKYLKQAVIDLEKHHAQFSLAEKQSKSKSLDDFNVKFLSEKQNLDEEEIKFSSEEFKPIVIHEDAEEVDNGILHNLQTLIWSMINLLLTIIWSIFYILPKLILGILYVLKKLIWCILYVLQTLILGILYPLQMLTGALRSSH